MSSSMIIFLILTILVIFFVAGDSRKQIDTVKSGTNGTNNAVLGNICKIEPGTKGCEIYSAEQEAKKSYEEILEDSKTDTIKPTKIEDLQVGDYIINGDNYMKIKEIVKGGTFSSDKIIVTTKDENGVETESEVKYKNIKDLEIKRINKSDNDKDFYREEYSEQSMLKLAKATNQRINSNNEIINNLKKLENEGFNTNLVKSIISIESSGKYSLEDTTRFECHKFIKKEKDSVSCTIEGDKTWSTVKSETNYNAFLEAKKINEDLAIRSSSFGLFQVLVDYSGYSPAEYSKRLKTIDGQFEIFKKYVKEKGIENEFKQKENINYEKIAIAYNGKSQHLHNYDYKIETAYKYFSSK